MKIVVSIPVHENVDVVVNQIENFQKYIPSVYIVLHIGENFQEKERLKEILHYYEQIFINPHTIYTAWGDIIYAHIDNFRYMCSQLDFDYFVMHASNDMYIKYGFEKYIEKYDAGFNYRKIRDGKSTWWPANEAKKDEQIKYILKAINSNTIIASQIESSFYRKNIMEKIVDIIENSEVYKNKAINYPREEIYFSTIASRLVDYKYVGDVTTFSEVHLFDRKVWKIRRLLFCIYSRSFLHFFLDIDKYNYIEGNFEEWLHNMGFCAITPKIVNKLRKDDYKYISKNSFLDDGFGAFRLYGNNIFSVKRVPRDMNCKLRKFINSIN